MYLVCEGRMIQTSVYVMTTPPPSLTDMYLLLHFFRLWLYTLQKGTISCRIPVCSWWNIVHTLVWQIASGNQRLYLLAVTKLFFGKAQQCLSSDRSLTCKRFATKKPSFNWSFAIEDMNCCTLSLKEWRNAKQSWRLARSTVTIYRRGVRKQTIETV